MLAESKETTMRRFLTITAAVALALVAAPATQAASRVVHTTVPHNKIGYAPVGHHPLVAPKVAVGVGSHLHNYNYLTTHGVKFNGGYFYKGMNHRQWTRWYWNARYGTYFYFDPFARSFYYWCATASCYYPASYINVAPPTVIVTPPLVLSGSIDDGMTPPPPIQ
jgi:hypothetical protein